MDFRWTSGIEPQVFLEEHDYIKLLSKEVAYGKVLKVFHFLLDEISSDPEKYKEWMKNTKYNSGEEKDRLEKLASVID